MASLIVSLVEMNYIHAYADSRNLVFHNELSINKHSYSDSLTATVSQTVNMPAMGATGSLQVRIGYNYPCEIGVCSHVVQDWTSMPFQTLRAVSGITQEPDSWIQPWYEMRAGYTGLYTGNRITDVNDPNGTNVYSSSGVWTFDEGTILEVAHQDMDKITCNGSGVPKGSLIFHDFYFESYSTLS